MIDQQINNVPIFQMINNVPIWEAKSTPDPCVVAGNWRLPGTLHSLVVRIPAPTQLGYLTQCWLNNYKADKFLF